MIEFRQVSKRYGDGHEALLGVNFSIAPKEMVFLTGHSGAGKSTLMKLILLMERATSGQVLVAEQNLAKLRTGQIPFCAARSAWYFKTTSSCSTAAFSTMWPCPCRYAA